MIEFIGARIAEPQQRQWRAFFKHHKLGFNVDAGRKSFREAIDQIFERNGVAFELTVDMRIRRLGPPEARRTVSDLRPDTGDELLDELIEESRRHFLSPRQADREARELTDLGNSFSIRHSETTQASLPRDAEDYLFTRMSAFIMLLLRSTSRLRED